MGIIVILHDSSKAEATNFETSASSLAISFLPWVIILVLIAPLRSVWIQTPYNIEVSIFFIPGYQLQMYAL